MSSNIPSIGRSSLDTAMPGSALPALTTGGAGDGIPPKERSIALARHALVKGLENYRASRPGNKGELDEEFIRGYNGKLLYPNLHQVLGETSLATLRRWRTMLDGSDDWTLLVRNYNREIVARLTPIEYKVFFGFLMSDNKISIGEAIRLTRFYLKQIGLPTSKSDMTFRREADDFKAKHYDIWVFMREGQKALKDKVEPYIKRDPSLLEVGDALVADGHRLNFQIINPFAGKPCRGVIVVYIDWKSFDLAGYEIMMNENTQVVASAMRNSIITLGKKPKVGYQDNGKAFKNRFFLGTASFEEAGFYGLFGRLGIIPIFAQPYNARAKIVERWFKEFSNTFERLFPSYIGSSIADKPAYMMRNEKFHKALHNDYVPTIDETVQFIEHWLSFHRSQECPHVKGKSIGDVFDGGRGPGVDLDELDDLMMDVKISTIKRNGITFLGADYYDDNLYGLREQVLIKYSLFDLSHIKVYAVNGEFICMASRVMSVHPLARVLGTAKDVAAVKHGIAQQRRLASQTVKLAKEYTKAGRSIELDWQKVTEITPRVVKQLEAQNAITSDTVERIPEEAVKDYAGDSPESTASPVIQGQSPCEVARLEPQTRPNFNTPIERYEWHLTHGVLTDEDAAWCVWFRTTDDFKMLMSYFQSQGKEGSGS